MDTDHRLSFNLCVGVVKTSPNGGGGATEGEPWLDPKYLPPEPPTTTAAEEAPPPMPSYSSITPGVLKTQGAAGGGKAGLAGGGRSTFVSGKLKPATLASSYFPKS